MKIINDYCEFISKKFIKNTYERNFLGPISTYNSAGHS